MGLRECTRAAIGWTVQSGDGWVRVSVNSVRSCLPLLPRISLFGSHCCREGVGTARGVQGSTEEVRFYDETASAKMDTVRDRIH